MRKTKLSASFCEKECCLFSSYISDPHLALEQGRNQVEVPPSESQEVRVPPSESQEVPHSEIQEVPQGRKPSGSTSFGKPKTSIGKKLAGGALVGAGAYVGYKVPIK